MPRRHTHQSTHRSLPLDSASVCQRKRRFSTEAEARRAADTQMLTDVQLSLDVYRCDHCRGWHLTRQT